MEIGVIHTPGCGRLIATITNAADTTWDLSAFVGSYVTLETDQAVRFGMIPLAGSWSIDPTGALTATGARAKAAGAIAGTPCDPSLGGPLPQILVSAAFPRLIIRAKAGGTSATFVAVQQTSYQVLPPAVTP
jgi:hypothetical protein